MLIFGSSKQNQKRNNRIFYITLSITETEKGKEKRTYKKIDKKQGGKGYLNSQLARNYQLLVRKQSTC